MRNLEWGQTITYTTAYGWYHQGKQLPEDGPYTGGVVGFEDDGLGGTVVQVRADGWMGDAPIYAVDPTDIIAASGKSTS
jgi:hypothetical protein